MNIGAYIIICGVGAALMIIGFWIGYIFRTVHESPRLTPGEVQNLVDQHVAKHRELFKQESRDAAIEAHRKSVGSIHEQMEKDLAAGRTFPDPWTGVIRVDPEEKVKDAPKV